MNNDTTPINESNMAPSAESGDDPEVEGHYLNQLAVEQEAMLRQTRLLQAGERQHHPASDNTASNGIIDRIRRRIDR